MEWLISVFLHGVVLTLLAIRYIHIFQLEGYKQKQFRGYLKENPLHPRYYVFFLLCAAVRVLFNLLHLGWVSMLVGEAAVVLAALALLMPEWGMKYKKPLVYTKRVIRLLVAVFILSFGVAWVLDYLSTFVPYGAGALGGACLILAPYIVVAAGDVTKPIEKMIHQHFINDAKRILAERSDLIKVAVTGSYGKTSTKFILATLLSEKYNCLVTPKSYNTPMGVVKVIRNMLDIEHEVFVCEMGARQRGDIQELCDIVHPDYGLITTVGKQHLETFGSEENIALGKYELIENLPENGAAFFPANNPVCVEMYHKTKVEKYLFGQDGYVRAEDVTVSNLGSTFTLVCPDGDRIVCTTKLLGKYNIDNILGCVAVAFRMGLTKQQIQRGLMKVKPVEHRLQLIPKGGLTIIDDAYNSNPLGAQMALEVLSGFAQNRIIITPGIVELGAEHVNEHIKLGRKIAECVDVAILVGPKRTRPIYDGIMEAGFTGRVEVVKSFNEAMELVNSFASVGDTVLFENDLPDNFNE